MLIPRLATERGHAEHGWLTSHHTFSFADYHDPRHMGFATLRVINDDTVAGGGGFPSHAHRDMEIISYVISGALRHQDSMGNGSVIKPGDVQRMSAGRGVVHSEQNASATEPVHFLQIWVLPEKAGLPSGYEQTTFSDAEKRGRLRLVVSRDGAEGSVKIQQDAKVYASLLAPGERVEHVFGSEGQAPRRGWVHVVRGAVQVAGKRYEAGDGVAVQDEPRLTLEGAEGPALGADGVTGEILLFSL